MKTTKTFLFYDTETTWLVSDKKTKWRPLDSEPTIVQLAWILWTYEIEHDMFDNIESIKVVEEKSFDYLFKSINPIPQKLTEIHWISDEMVKDMNLCSQSDLFKEFLWRTRKVDHIVWHNIKFDIDMTVLEARRMFHEVEFAWWIDEIVQKSICTMNWTVAFCQLPAARWGLKKPKLAELHHVLFNEWFDNAHNALADIEATKKCFFELIDNKVLTLKLT